MDIYETYKNETIDIDLEQDYILSGWSFVNGKAVHSGVNLGAIVNSVFVPIANTNYTIKISVSYISPGYLEIGIGGVVFDHITAPGVYYFTEDIVNNEPMYLKAGASDIVVDYIEISTGIVESETIVFDAASKLYNGNISLFGDFLSGFFEDLIVFRNGVPWIQDKSDSINTFFGVKFPSVIKFYCNIDYDKDKDFYSLTFNGTMPWDVDLYIDKSDGKGNGQRSRIKRGNFKLDHGRYTGNVLRDMNDPRFTDEVQALMKGAYMQGKVMEVTLTNNSSELFHLTTVEIDLAVK